jgi:hypothetical protein
MNVRTARLALGPWLALLCKFALACSLSLTTACSFVFVNSPPSDVPEEEAARSAPDCTSSQAMPVLDVAAVAASGLNVALVGASDRYTEDQKNVLMPLHAVYGVVYAVSAVYGFHQTSKCKALKEKFEREGAQWKPALKSDNASGVKP